MSIQSPCRSCPEREGKIVARKYGAVHICEDDCELLQQWRENAPEADHPAIDPAGDGYRVIF